MSWQLLNERNGNALESAMWGVVLAEPLVQRHQQAIQANDSVFEDVITQKAVGAQLMVQMGSGGNPVMAGAAANQPANLSYHRVASDGSIPLRLSIAGATLAVVNSAYKGWSEDKIAAFDLLARLSKALADVQGPIPISHLELVYKDLFWWDGEWNPAHLGDLLERNTKWTPGWVFDARSFWHNDIGEVVVLENANVVERLAIHCIDSTVDDARRTGVTMNTTVRWLGPSPTEALPLDFHSAFGSERDGAEAWFETMHDLAKAMFAGALSHPCGRS